MLYLLSGAKRRTIYYSANVKKSRSRGEVCCPHASRLNFCVTFMMITTKNKLKIDHKSVTSVQVSQNIPFKNKCQSITY